MIIIVATTEIKLVAVRTTIITSTNNVIFGRSHYGQSVLTDLEDSPNKVRLETCYE